MPRARPIRATAIRVPRRGRRRKSRPKPVRQQRGGNFIFKLLSTVAKTLDALT